MKMLCFTEIRAPRKIIGIANLEEHPKISLETILQKHQKVHFSLQKNPRTYMIKYKSYIIIWHCTLIVGKTFKNVCSTIINMQLNWPDWNLFSFAPETHLYEIFVHYLAETDERSEVIVIEQNTYNSFINTSPCLNGQITESDLLSWRHIMYREYTR